MSFKEQRKPESNARFLCILSETGLRHAAAGRKRTGGSRPSPGRERAGGEWRTDQNMSDERKQEDGQEQQQAGSPPPEGNAQKGGEQTTIRLDDLKGRFLSNDLADNMSSFDRVLQVEKNFDILKRVFFIGERQACFYFIDGFHKDDTLQRLLQYFYGLKAEDTPQSFEELLQKYLPYGELELVRDMDKLLGAILSGKPALIVDGFGVSVTVDFRDYPARSVSEPDKDKAMRGSKDGFVETLVFNTALIRRRIRTPQFTIEMLSVGKSSRTDIAMCYMEDRVDKKFLDTVTKRIKGINIDALTMNQQSLAECMFGTRWLDPFPKFKYSERPDTAAACILEGNIVLLVDNSPSAMILPASIFDIVEEADDYYFPPVTGTYLRLTRFLISILTYIMTPTFLLLMENPQWVPESFQFIMLQEESNIPLIAQFLILELAIDGLKLAAVNTPNMLSTPLSVMAALVLGEFSVNSGWFNSEVMLYMAFVAIANYTQQNYELGYALKFMRIINLILTAIFGIYGYVGAIVFFLLSIVFNKTLSNKSYIYPLLPFNFRQLAKRLLRLRLPETKQ